MPDQNFLTGAMQESLLTLLAFDDVHAKTVVGQLDLKYFDRPYRDLAEKIIDYRQRFRSPPGAAHLDDLFDAMLESGDQQNRTLIHNMLEGMVRQSKNLNAEYVSNRVTDFIRRQVLKDAVVRAGEAIGQGGENTDDRVAAILEKAIKFREQSTHLGVRLSSVDDTLGFLDHPAEVFSWGIKQLDHYELGPTRKELLLYIAPRKKGKTWAMVHLGKMNLMLGWRVLHISLEMSEQKISQRYLQSLFGVAKRPERSTFTHLDLDEFGNIQELRKDHRMPRLHFADADIRRKLANKIKQGGARFNNLIIKSWPSGTLTTTRLNSYLDYLESAENFMPDIILVDYPNLMSIDAKNFRLELGRRLVELRGIADERNAAMVCPTQGNRQSQNAREVDESDVGEDISMVATADTIITYSQTKAEKSLKLARLTVTNARNDADGVGVLVAQDYATGQFCLDSSRLTNKYDLALKRATGDMTDGDDDD